MSKRKLKDIWLLLKSKHYAVLIGDSENEIAWAIDSLRKADIDQQRNKLKGLFDGKS